MDLERRAQPGLPRVLLLRRTLAPVNATSCGPAVIGIGGDVNFASTSSRDGLMPFVDTSSCSSLPPTRSRNGLAIDENQELVRPVVAFDAEEPSSTPRRAAQKNVLAVGREIVVDERAAARAERQAVEMVVLRQVERDSVGDAVTTASALPTAMSATRSATVR